MVRDILIIGQGLAGTLLAWELERAGISFVIADRGHAGATSSAAAGIINPITGRRLVKSWRVDSLLPVARATYEELGRALGVPLWREMRVRRFFADEREQAVAREKLARGDLAPFAGAGDDAGIWILDAAHVELGALLAGARQRWRSAGRLREGALEPTAELARHERVIDCTGVLHPGSPWRDCAPWEYSKGELLELAVGGLVPDVVLSRRHWILPLDRERAWVGATHEPGVADRALNPTARAQLEASARDLLGGEAAFTVTGQRAGVRVNLPDKRPVAGRHPDEPRLGLINALGGKGVLWAPMLARQWVNHLTSGAPFDPEIDVQRYAAGRRPG